MRSNWYCAVFTLGTEMFSPSLIRTALFLLINPQVLKESLSTETRLQCFLNLQVQHCTHMQDNSIPQDMCYHTVHPRISLIDNCSLFLCCRPSFDKSNLGAHWHNLGVFPIYLYNFSSRTSRCGYQCVVSPQQLLWWVIIICRAFGQNYKLVAKSTDLPYHLNYLPIKNSCELSGYDSAYNEAGSFLCRPFGSFGGCGFCQGQK